MRLRVAAFLVSLAAVRAYRAHTKHGLKLLPNTPMGRPLPCADLGEPYGQGIPHFRSGAWRHYLLLIADVPARVALEELAFVLVSCLVSVSCALSSSPKHSCG